jgi:RimJ/RimL family protein N-acetyltransferase
VITEEPVEPDRGPTVTLRGHRPDDVQPMWEQCQDPLFQAWTPVPIPYSHADAQEHLTALARLWERGQEWSFAVEHEGRYAGTVSLRHLGGTRAELTFGTHPWVRGRGVTDRALRLLLGWGFDQLGLDTIRWWAAVGNWGSRRVAWRLGFAFEGTVRRALPHRGELRDAWVGTLLAGEPWEPRTTWLRPPAVDAGPVRLRAVHERDLPRVVEACMDAETSFWLGTQPAPYLPDHAVAWLERVRGRLADGEAMHWAVTDPSTDVFLGSVSLFGLGAGSAELGFWSHPDARGGGHMSPAARAAVTYAFESLGVQVVRASAAVGDTASRRVIEKAGLQPAGIARRRVLTREGLVDAACYDALPPERSEGRPAG